MPPADVLSSSAGNSRATESLYILVKRSYFFETEEVNGWGFVIIRKVIPFHFFGNMCFSGKCRDREEVVSPFYSKEIKPPPYFWGGFLVMESHPSYEK